MEKLSPEDISRAREWREKHGWHLTFIGDWTDERVAAYSAAENERILEDVLEMFRRDYGLPKDGDFVTVMKLIDAAVDRAEAAEAKYDRLKGALEKIGALELPDSPFSMMQWIRRAKREALAALRPEGE